MGLIEDRPRFATVRALEPTRLVELSEGLMRSVFVEQPDLLYRTIQMLSARLREADLQMIEDLRRKNRELALAYEELLQAQASLVEMERLEHELDLARQLQQSILPQEFPDVAGVSCAARSHPARQVGGDFYDVIPLGPRRLGLVMADVSDKGMPAALFMGLVRSLIRAETGHSDSPREVLLSVHRLLMSITQANMFVTVFYGVLDLAKGTLCYARAGHDRPLHFCPSQDACRFLAGQGMLLGIVEPVELEELEVPVRDGDVLVLYTDGITDANSPAEELFGADRLRETVCTARSRSAPDLLDRILDRVGRFQAGAVQYDDMALLVVSVDRAGSNL
jgi:serine phosphatase RsbU (regulator of sigma subunit)